MVLGGIGIPGECEVVVGTGCGVADSDDSDGSDADDEGASPEVRGTEVLGGALAIGPEADPDGLGAARLDAAVELATGEATADDATTVEAAADVGLRSGDELEPQAASNAMASAAPAPMINSLVLATRISSFGTPP